LKLANPELKVVVFSGDGDLVTIGGNHLIHAARRNIDVTVLCANNFNYGMTGGQLASTTPLTARTTTSRLGSTEMPFNIPHLAAASGAVYVARWTTVQVYQLEKAITEALLKRGFSLVEVISPCPTCYGRMNSQATGLEQMKYYRENSVIKHGADPKYVDIEFNGQIVVGKFIDIDRPSLPHLQGGHNGKSV
jgi:2-oxoglutarate ferredoxin oxidoreductase subunit beta